MPHDLYCSG